MQEESARKKNSLKTESGWEATEKNEIWTRSKISRLSKMWKKRCRAAASDEDVTVLHKHQQDVEEQI